jgi:HSP20 family molecular chaperone IbpA
MAKNHNDLISFPMRVSQEVERMFDELIHRPWGFCRDIRGWNPSVDLYETDEAFILEADLPGVKAADVKLEVQNGELVLQGWRSLEQSHGDGRFHTMERSSGQFVRRITLPESIEKHGIEAEFKDGVLRVILPKLKQHKGVRSIDEGLSILTDTSVEDRDELSVNHAVSQRLKELALGLKEFTGSGHNGITEPKP